MFTPAKLFPTTKEVFQEDPSTSVDNLVVKVGGSLLRRAEDYAAVAGALAPRIQDGPVWIVVSAAKGVTDALEALDGGAGEADQVLDWHRHLAGGRLDADIESSFHVALQESRKGRPQSLLAWGERASAALLRRHLARLGHDVPTLELEPQSRAPALRHVLIPGFFLRDGAGRLQVLPRGGSDISAVLAAQWCQAREVHLWKEGGGIRLEPGVTVERVDTQTILAWLGDRVRPVHPEAVRLAAELGIALTLTDPWGRDGATCIEHAATAGPIPPKALAQRVAGEASP